MQLPKIKKNSIDADMLKAAELISGICLLAFPRFWPSVFTGTWDGTACGLIMLGLVTKHDNGDLQIGTWRIPILKIKQIYDAIPTVHSAPPPPLSDVVSPLSVPPPPLLPK